MNPAQKALIYQQMYNANPIDKGALSGMQAAKESVGLDARERQNKMAQFIGHLGMSMATPGHSTALGAMASQMPQSVAAANQYENDIIAQNQAHQAHQEALENQRLMRNFELMKYEDSLEKQARAEALKGRELDIYGQKQTSGSGLTPGMRLLSIMTADQKNEIGDFARDLGIPTEEVYERLANHETREHIAASVGRKLEDVKGKHYSTKATQTDMAKTRGRTAELLAVEPTMTKYRNYYPTQVGGYVPGLYLDAALGRNIDKQGDYLAQRLMSTDLANIKLAIAGGSTTESITHDLIKKGFGNTKMADMLANKEVYQRMSDTVNMLVRKMAEARLRGQSGQMSDEELFRDHEHAEAPVKPKMLIIQNSKGETKEVTVEEAQRMRATK